MPQVMDKFKVFAQRLYRPKYMVNESLVLGPLPTTRDGYSVAFGTAGAAIAETFLISLIGMVDTLMVSGLGESAIAAVGIVNNPRYLVQALIFAINIAITSICARRKGEGNQEGAVDCLKQGLILSFVCSIALSAMFFPLSKGLIGFMGANSDIIDPASGYLRVLLLGLPLANLSSTISAAQRGVGNTKASMAINMTANIVNVIGNYLLIEGRFGAPRLGITGAGIATVIGWGVGLLLGILSILYKDSSLNIKFYGSWKLRKETLMPIGKIVSGSFLEQLFIRFGFISYTKVVSGLGTIMYAAHEILMNLMSLSFSFGEGFGIAASSLVGQNLGAKRPDLSIVYGKICQRMSLISSAILFFVFIFFGQNLVGFFSKDASIHSVAAIIMPMIVIILFAQASQMVFMGALRGAGDTKYTAVISMISIMIVRPVIGYICAYSLGLGLPGAWVGLIIDQIIRLLLTYRRFSSGKWTEIKL